jgi:potassium efflux system protein
MCEHHSRHPGLSRKQRVLNRFLIIALTSASVCAVANGQGQQLLPFAPSPTPVPSAEASPTAKPVPTPIPLAEVATQAEADTASLREMQIDSASDQTTATIETELPALTREIDARLAENSGVLSGTPSLETLSTLEAGWQKVNDNLTAWERDLTASANQLHKEINGLAGQADTWEQTLRLAQATDGTPPEVLQSIEAVINSINQTRSAVETRRAHVLVLQSQVVEQVSRVTAALDSIRQARNAAVNRLFVRNSPPAWSADVRSRAGQNLMVESQNSFSTQLAGLRAYAERQRDRFFLHLVVILLLIAALYWVRRTVKPWVEEEPSLKRPALVFDIPVEAAVVLSIMASDWIYPEAPRLWITCLGAIAITPSIIILRRLVERPLFPILNALVVFYFVDLLRTVAASQRLTSRLLLLVEILAAILFLVWQIHSLRSPKSPEEERDRLTKTIKRTSRIALVPLATAFVANALGYVSLANLVGNAVLRSAYLAVILSAAMEIAYLLVMFTLRVRPLTLLNAVRNNLPLFRRRVRRLLQWAALLIWLIYTLELLTLREPVLQMITEVLKAKLVLGSFEISLGNVLAFAVTVWAAFLLSNFVRFILEEDVYPHLRLARGIPYAVSTMLRYVILLVGFLVAIAALGIDMTKFTILAGAFGLGLGFGLQNILNNFVSGLIVLFERPVNVGDVIRLNEAEGVVKRIGFRASVISAGDGSDVIVPNSKLISDTVTNWTLLNRRRRVDIRVGAAYGTDPARVIELLKGVARAHPLVAADPQPQVLLVEFGTDSLNFELRAWVDDVKQWLLVRTDLAIAINSAFAAENISMPYPQRGLLLRNIDPEALETIAGQGTGQSNQAPSLRSG